MKIEILLGVLGYLVLMLWIGQKTGQKIATTRDYVLAGRRLPFWLNMTSLFATWFGAETCLGAAGAAYDEGLLGVIEDPLGAALCLFILGAFVAPAMVRMNVLTLSDYMEQRFGKGFGVLSAVCFIAAYVSWLGSQLVAFGYILYFVTGFPALWGTLIGSAVVLTYTYRGGLLADAWTDFIQAMVLIPGLLVLFFVVMKELGGWQGFVGSISPGAWRLLPVERTPLKWLDYVQAWAIIGLGSLPSQDLYQRVSGGKGLRTVRAACFSAGFLYLTIGMIPVLLGLAAKSMKLPLDASEHVLLSLAGVYLHPVGMVLFLGALLSAIMSTADSVILAPATLFTNNILRSHLKDTSDANILLWCRRSTIGVTAVALLLTLVFEGIYALTMNSSALLMATLLAPFLAGIFWPRANRAGALAAVGVGGVIFVLGKIFWNHHPVTLVAFLGAAAALAATVVVTGRSGAQPLKI